MHNIVDDFLAKYRTRDQYWKILEKVFEIFLKNNIRLNPKKYVFGVT